MEAARRQSINGLLSGLVVLSRNRHRLLGLVASALNAFDLLQNGGDGLDALAAAKMDLLQFHFCLGPGDTAQNEQQTKSYRCNRFHSSSPHRVMVDSIPVGGCAFIIGNQRPKLAGGKKDYVP